MKEARRGAAKEGGKSCFFFFYILTSGKNKESYQKLVSSLGSIKTNSLISGAKQTPNESPSFPTKEGSEQAS